MQAVGGSLTEIASFEACRVLTAKLRMKVLVGDAQIFGSCVTFRVPDCPKNLSAALTRSCSFFLSWDGINLGVDVFQLLFGG
jgi:hypothetical protein